MPLRVLIVDDNRDAADCLGLLLALFGADTRVCYGGADALAQAAGFRPHAGLLDIDMPGMSGLELARRLRAQHGRGLLLVAVTGVSTPEAREATAAAGLDWHLTKPVDGTALAGRLLAFHQSAFPADW